MYISIVWILHHELLYDAMASWSFDIIIWLCVFNNKALDLSISNI
jgi:hypothetical protein